MKKLLLGLAATAAVFTLTFATSNPASARWGYGWGAGPGFRGVGVGYRGWGVRGWGAGLGYAGLG